MSCDADEYPRIGDYALIADGQSVALVSSRGCVDWCCMPRMDRGSIFGRILDWHRGGHCCVHAAADEAIYTRAYVDDSMVLETTIRTGTGVVRVLDCFALSDDPTNHELIRLIDAVEGTVTLAVEVCARFDYGELRPWVRQRTDGTWTATGGDDGIIIASDFPLEESGGTLVGDVTVRRGSSHALCLRAVPPDQVDDIDLASPTTANERVDETNRRWRTWLESKGAGATADCRRSALVLRSLTDPITGAIAAAPTTSLPEAIGGGANWDYRFTWVRDSDFSSRSLAELGFNDEADRFRRFIERTTAGDAEKLQVMYGLDGRRHLDERELGLSGYRDSRPVRIGNAASKQLQLDVYGEVLCLAWRWHRRGNSPDNDYWRFLAGLVDLVGTRWESPDCGLWESRGTPLHYVHSKVMCWAAVDRGIRLAEETHRAVPDGWRSWRDAIRSCIDAKGVDQARDCFVRDFDSTDVDAALLLLPSVEFVAYDDPRMINTTDVVARELDRDGLLIRYRRDDVEEGAFVACTFWLAECYAGQGRVDEAWAAYRRAAATANDLGLFSEEYDGRRRELLGNFPQGLSHLSQISAAVALASLDG